MPPLSPDQEREKQELESLLASGIFSRAPGLAHLLSYVCQKHFAGEEGGIKEYNLAVEALGRPADFDQKKDSIVRVEIYRLRKRLQEYYAKEGEAHAVHISIPPGQYTPKFTVREPRAEIVQSGADPLTLDTVERPARVFSVAFTPTHGSGSGFQSRLGWRQSLWRRPSPELRV